MTPEAVLASLTPECRALTQRVIAACAAENLIMRPYFGIRDPITQAKLWRQSRSTVTINAEIASLRGQGCGFIADCLVKAGPQNGKWATNALPGLSWHQWGQACDLVSVMADGNFDWDNERIYLRFGAIVNEVGGWWGGAFGDNDHLQRFRDEPLAHFGGMKAINDALKVAWPGLV